MDIQTKMNTLTLGKVWEDAPEEQRKVFQEFRAAHPYTEFDFEDLRGNYIGCGRGPQTLLFLPGAFVDADAWIHSIIAFEKDYRIISVGQPTKTLQMDSMPGFICRILEREKVEKATFIGASAGGGAAQHFLQHRPDKVEHMVLSHCTTLNPETAQRVRSSIKIFRLLPIGMIRLMMKARSRKYPPSSRWVEFTKAYARQFMPTLDKETMIGFLEAAATACEEFDFDPEVIRSWPGKMLILSTTGDKISFPRIGELQARYPTAESHIFGDGGHATLMLFPDVYNSVLKSFLTAAYGT